MSKISKTILAAMIAGNDGVTVAQDGAKLQVAFAFSDNLVHKMHTVPDAVFDKEGGVWNVPEASADKLVDAVADMRDFVRNNGVQVKDMDGGGKLVLFDYNKQMTQIIGPVAGAKFNQGARGWIVPADSKDMPYLDRTINQMRGVGIESANDRDTIIDLAAASPELKDAKIAPVFAQPGQLYSGKMVSVNGNYAAQLSNIKDGTAFTVIHKLADIGDVFKGQNLHIGYDDNRHVDIRTSDLYQKQQAERATLTEMASGLVDGAVVKNASLKDGGKYSGAVMEVTDNMLLLSAGRKEFTIHRRDVLGDVAITKGQNIEVSYKGGKGAAVDTDKKKSHDKEVVR